METSALQAENVEKLFYQIAEILVSRRQSNNGVTGVNQSPSSVQIDDTAKKPAFAGCLSQCQQQ